MFKFFKTGFQKIKDALKKTSSLFGKKLRKLFSKPLSDESLYELERILFEADIGSKLVYRFLDVVKKAHKKNPDATSAEYLEVMRQEAESLLSEKGEISGNQPYIGCPRVILVVGVNGTGKTTTIAKLAKKYQDEGKKVLLAAADTFRAAAVDQLTIWADRIGVEIVKGAPGGDPSSVLFDAMAKGKAKGFDVILIDTAGRLESKGELMRELEKMARIAKKQDDLAPHEVFITIDSTLGQTAVEQVRIFDQAVPLTGLIITKIDGSAKGGVVLAIYAEKKIPIHYIGVGEKMDDLIEFDPKSYTEALFSD